MASVMNFCARRYLSVSAAKYSGTAAVSGSHEGKFSKIWVPISFEVMHLELCNFEKSSPPYTLYSPIAALSVCSINILFEAINGSKFCFIVLFFLPYTVRKHVLNVDELSRII